MIGKLTLFRLLAVVGLLAAAPAVAGSFPLSYGGRLTDGAGTPVAGPVDLEVRFFRVPSGGTQVGATVALPATALSDGTFQAALDVGDADFNAVFNDVTSPVWLEVTDVTHAKVYPRQRFTMVPYAARVPVDGTTIQYDANGKLTVPPATSGAPGLIKATGSFVDVAANGDITAIKQAQTFTTPLAGDVTGPQGATVVGAIRGKAVSGTLDASSDGKVLKWDNVSQTFKLLNDNSSGGLSAGDVTSSIILDGEVRNADVNAAANIDASKLGTGAVDNTHFNYLAGVTSDLQTQLDGKQATVTETTDLLLRGVRLQDNDGTANYVELKAPASVGSDVSYTLPAAPVAGQYLKTDAAGVLSWATPSGTITDANTNGTPDDAERLGGQLPAYYRNASNLNAGTVGSSYLPIATNLLPGAIKATSTYVTVDGTGAITALTADSAGGFTGALAGDVQGNQGTTSVKKLQGRDVASAAPSGGNVLKWNSTNTTWEPGGVAFDQLTTGSNTTATMTVGTGGSLVTAGTGVVEATRFKGAGGTNAVDLDSSEVAGALTVDKGGTGLTGTPANGQLAIGNGTGYALATVTGGTGINVTNGAGTITIAATADASTKVAKAGDTLTGALLEANGTAGAPSYAFSGSTGTGLWAPVNGELALSTGGTERVRIDGSGNVGIGASPGTRLDVRGTTNDNSAAAFSLASSTGVSLLYVRNDGNIGIGTTSVGASNFGNLLTIASTGGRQSGASGVNVSMLESNGSGTVGITTKAGSTGASTSGYATALTASVASSGTGGITTATGLTSGLTVSNTGAVGTYKAIAATAPAVSGGGAVTTAYGLYLEGQEVAGVTTGWGLYQIGANDTNYLNGSLGVGTSSPGEKLTVAGRVESTSGGFKFPDGTVQTTAASNAGIGNTMVSGWPDILLCDLDFTGGTSYAPVSFIYSNKSSTMTWYTAPAAIGGGIALIGFNADGSYNQVYGTVNGVGSASWTWQNCKTQSISQIYTAGRAYNLIKGPAAQWLQTGSDAYYNAGKVGIGTTSPTTHLDSQTEGGFDTISSTTYGSGFWGGFQSRAARGTQSAPTASQANDVIGGIIAKGYGATGWASASRARVNFFASENWTDAAQGAYMTFGTTADGTTAAAERMRITAGGNVGIGTTSPGQKLTVAGTVESTTGGFKFPDATTQATAVVKPAAGEGFASGPLSLSTSYADVPGASVTINPAVAVNALVHATCDITVNTAGDTVVCRLLVDGSAASQQIVMTAASGALRATLSQSYLIPLAAGSHTLKIQAVNLTAARGTVSQTHTGITYLTVGQ